MKCAIRQMISEKPELEKLVNLVQGNVGFVLTNGDMKEIRDLVMTFKVPAAARSGAIAPVPVLVPKRPLSSRLFRFLPKLPEDLLKSHQTSLCLQLVIRSLSQLLCY